MLAKTEFEHYLADFPMDYYAHSMYSSVLIRLRQFELAEKVIDGVMSITARLSLERREELEVNLFYNKLAVLSYTSRFNELYEYINKRKDYLTRIKGIEALLYFCEKQLGILKLTKSKSNKYLINQIIDYSESDMIEHVKRHLADFYVHGETLYFSVFCENFPFNEVLEAIKKNIFSKNGICLGLYDESYFFKFDNCGKDNYRTTDYFKVVCFQNTNQIITMYPEVNCEKLPFVDLNYLNPNISNGHSKVISQRDKFNKRYNRGI